VEANVPPPEARRSDSGDARNDPPETASLHVVVLDWGHIWVDDKYRGPSPQTIRGLKVGEHTVGLAEDSTGPATKTHKLTLGPGRTSKTFKLVKTSLEPKTQ
jgi:hypothetical protein